MNKKNNHKIFIIAGEASGDLHGSGLMRSIKACNPNIIFSGLGGEKMEKEGLESIVSIDKLAVMGFVEVAKNLSFFLNLEKLIIKNIVSTNPKKIILIDYPGFNLRIAQKIKKISNIQITYYISPQLWAWKEKRVEIIRNNIDDMIVVFPFEKQWYKKRNIDVKYFGNPIIDNCKPYNFSGNSSKEIINVAICPGSREQEIYRHMPVISKTIKNFKNEMGDKIQFIIVRAKNIKEKTILSYVNSSDAIISEESIFTVFEKADCGVVASGTASLECAITKKPIVVIYKMSWISWLITKIFVNVKFACIANILMNKKIIPELLQAELTVKNLSKHLKNIISLKPSNEYQQNIDSLIASLGDGNSYENTAKYIVGSSLNVK
ncbi:MAG: lipid-A-disaccharide synthase [Candidatus Marinimicrobia bacterium]|nr:lipid-A-disaccharide synthase [Candidatus Neomarinimicrobiota bacterium]|tara:strand:- start:2328 stop:3461 length:1134 start_codon:yes stop_codon:yes gene_type:complete